MVEYARLIKLHIEFDRDKLSRLQFKVAKTRFNLTLATMYSRYEKASDIRYPVSFRKLKSLIKVKFTPSTVFLGLLYDSLSAEDKEIYKKILEVEYGVNGIEQRVLRRALEECFINL